MDRVRVVLYTVTHDLKKNCMVRWVTTPLWLQALQLLYIRARDDHETEWAARGRFLYYSLSLRVRLSLDSPAGVERGSAVFHVVGAEVERPLALGNRRQNARVQRKASHSSCELALFRC